MCLSSLLLNISLRYIIYPCCKCADISVQAHLKGLTDWVSFPVLAVKKHGLFIPKLLGEYLVCPICNQSIGFRYTDYKILPTCEEAANISFWLLLFNKSKRHVDYNCTFNVWRLQTIDYNSQSSYYKADSCVHHYVLTRTELSLFLRLSSPRFPCPMITLTHNSGYI